MIADMGANLNMTRTPDCHFFAESRHNGTKTVVFSPDFSQVSKYADQWVPLHAGSDGAFWMAVSHVILKEFHQPSDHDAPYFLDYVKRYTDSPFLVKLEKKTGEHYEARSPATGRDGTAGRRSSEVRAPQRRLEVRQHRRGERRAGRAQGQRRATAGTRQKGNWNLKQENSADDEPYSPVLTLLDEAHDEVLQTEFTEFGLDQRRLRGVPVRYVDDRGASGDHGLRPDHGPVRRGPRPGWRLPRGLRRTRTRPTLRRGRRSSPGWSAKDGRAVRAGVGRTPPRSPVASA